MIYQPNQLLTLDVLNESCNSHAAPGNGELAQISRLKHNAKLQHQPETETHDT